MYAGTVVGFDSAQGNAQNATSLSWTDVITNTPSGATNLQAGDRAYLYWTHTQGSAESTIPSGFTQIKTQDDGTLTYSLYRRVMSGGETGGIGTVGAGSIQRQTWILVVVRGYSGEDVVTSAADAGTDANHTTPAATPTSTDVGVLIGNGSKVTAGPTSTTPPAAFTLATQTSTDSTSRNFGAVAYEGSGGTISGTHTAGVAINPGTFVDNVAASDNATITVLLIPLVQARDISDSAPGTDTLARSSTCPRPVSDTAAGTDALARTSALPRPLSDSAAATDALARAVAESRSTADTASATDTLAQAVANPRALSDTAAATDSMSGSVTSGTQSRSASDAASASDTVARALAEPRALADTAGATDVVARSRASSRAIGDTGPATDVVARASTRVRSVGDTATASDVVARASARQRAVADSAAATDAIARTSSAWSRSTSNTAPATDVVTRSVLDARAVGDTAAASDSCARSAALPRPTGDTAAASDGVARSLTQARAVGDSAPATEVLFTGTPPLSRPVSDSASATETLARVVFASRGLGDGASAADSLTAAGTRARSCADTAAAADQVARTVTGSHPVSDTASGSDTLARSVWTARPIGDAAGLTDLATRSLTTARTALDTLLTTDVVSTGVEPGIRDIVVTGRRDASRRVQVSDASRTLTTVLERSRTHQVNEAGRTTTVLERTRSTHHRQERTVNLSRLGREFYVQEIATTPAVSSWDASFDGGTTWVAGAAVAGETDQWRWLLRGPQFDEQAHVVVASTLITEALVEPLLRATDNPEVVIESGTTIVLLH